MEIAKATAFSLLFISVIAGATAQTNQSATETVATLDNTTRLTDVYWGETTTFSIYSEIPKMVSITDINSIESSGSGQVNFKQFRLSPGLNNISMSVTLDGSDRSVTIADSNSMIYTSNPGKPLFQEINRTDFYIEAIMVAVFLPIQVLFRLKWFRYRLKSGLTRVV